MCITYINFLILILLTILISVNSAILNEDDKLILIQVEYGYNISNFSLEVLNRDDAEINDFLSSRIAFMNGSSFDNEIFDVYSAYINKYWMFIVNSSSVVDSLLERDDYKKNELYINGIIVPKSLNYKMPEKNNNKKIPIFIVNDNITENLSIYDIRYMNKHTYFLFAIERAISTYPETLFLVISIILIIVGLGMTVYWKIKMKSLARINILYLHRFLYLIPFFMTFVSITLIVKAVDIRGRDPNIEYEDSIYVDTALITLSAIYKTILWFLILMVSLGWRISIQSLRREDLKFFTKMFLLIYVVMCLDQIIDSTGVKVWVFHLSEIKNIIFYAGMMILLLKKVSKTIRFLERKLYFARALTLEYVEALVYKIKLMNQFKLMLFIYIGVYILVLIIHKTAVAPYDSSLLETFDYTTVDFFLSVYLLLLFRPTQLPPNFSVDLGNNVDEDIGIIYKAFLPQYNSINNAFKENPKDIQNLKGKNIPILVLGPCLSRNDTGGEAEININNYINNIEVGFAT